MRLKIGERALRGFAREVKEDPKKGKMGVLGESESNMLKFQKSKRPILRKKNGATTTNGKRKKKCLWFGGDHKFGREGGRGGPPRGEARGTELGPVDKWRAEGSNITEGKKKRNRCATCEK